MAARYYVQVAQELLDADPQWESAGLTLIERGALLVPDWRWCLFEDGAAPEELNGKKVELTFESLGGVPGSARIADRQVID